ncbi:MAG: hypothetical protein WD061_00045, partial [Candidatus Saccharimonadales bacterium]
SLWVTATATSTGEANTIALRNALGQLQVTNPENGQDAANKNYVDNVIFSDEINSSYVLVATDEGKLKRLNNADEITLTIPTNASVSFNIGTRIEIYASGSGGVTITGEEGVIVRNSGTLSQYSTAILTKHNTDEWVVSASSISAGVITGPTPTYLIVGKNGAFGGDTLTSLERLTASPPWTNDQYTSNIIWTGTCYIVGVADLTNGGLWKTRDGVNWELIGPPCTGLVWTGSKVIAQVNNWDDESGSHFELRTQATEDPVSDGWTIDTGWTGGGTYAMGWNGSYGVAVSINGSWKSDSSGDDWTQNAQTYPAASYHWVVSWFAREDIWVAMGYGNDSTPEVCYSSDGITWTALDPGVMDSSAAYSGCVGWPSGLGRLVMAGNGNSGDGNEFAYSDTGSSSWSVASSPTLRSPTVRSVIWTGSEFAATAQDGEILTSSNGSSWSKVADLNDTASYGQISLNKLASTHRPRLWLQEG